MMSGLILKNATLADGQRCNIVIKDNLIKEIVPRRAAVQGRAMQRDAGE